MEQQLSLADVLVHAKLGSNQRLEAIAAVIDWSELGRLVEKHEGRGQVGRPSYLALPLLKALYLQMLDDLSDAGLEEALQDRLSFRKFCGYRLEEVNRQLDAKGLILRKGTLMDATIIPAAARKPDLEEGKQARVAQEPGASFIRKGNRSYFGYRLHR